MTAETDAMRLVPEDGRVYVEVSGLTGTGKSAVMGEIEIALKALGLAVEHDADFRAEKNGTHADWQEALDLYRPTVLLRERNVSRAAALAHPPAQGSESGGEVDGLVGPLACLEEIAEASWSGDDAVARIQAFAARELTAALSQPGPASEGEAAPVSPDSDLLKEAVGLLRPFADEAAEWSDDQPDRLTLDRHNVPSVTIGHCRAARAFLSKVEERGHDAPQNPATEGVGS